MQEKIVSFDDEKLIIVDPEDKILNYKSKIECHEGDGILHRAFSVFIFNSNRQLLIHQRSELKLLWPLFWTNSCCSHPRKGELYEEAVNRRVEEELGIRTETKFLYKFQYHARYKSIGSESELCSVYIGRYDGKIHINKNEINDWKFIDLETLDSDIESNPEIFTPWFQMEWQKIKQDYMNKIDSL